MYDMDRDGFISNGELFLVLKVSFTSLSLTSFFGVLIVYERECVKAMVGSNLKDQQLQQIVDKSTLSLSPLFLLELERTIRKN